MLMPIDNSRVSTLVPVQASESNMPKAAMPDSSVYLLPASTIRNEGCGGLFQEWLALARS